MRITIDVSDLTINQAHRWLGYLKKPATDAATRRLLKTWATLALLAYARALPNLPGPVAVDTP